MSALHSFYRFVADREPLAAAQCAAVLRIPTKQAPVVAVRDLDEDEISAILAQPNRLKLEGQRDHVLLAFLYNTGARRRTFAEDEQANLKGRFQTKGLDREIQRLLNMQGHKLAVYYRSFNRHWPRSVYGCAQSRPCRAHVRTVPGVMPSFSAISSCVRNPLLRKRS